jgi:DNA-binding MarR family transcriptional regulator
MNNNIISKISLIRNKANDFIIAELKKIGINNLAPSHGHILHTLYKKDGIPMKEITEKINKKKNTVTILINKLIKNGYIYKTTCPEDKRLSKIYLTDKGKSFENNFNMISDRLNKKAFNNFLNKEEKELIKLLTKIENNFEVL